MSDRAARLRLRLDTARRRWRADRGAVAIRDAVAVAAVAIIVAVAAVAVLEVAGFDVGGWLGEQFGITSAG
jgi:uncharacterized membrane protein